MKAVYLCGSSGVLFWMRITKADIKNQEGLSLLFFSFRKSYSQVKKIWVDMGYRSKSLQEQALKKGFEIDMVKLALKLVTNPK